MRASSGLGLAFLVKYKRLSVRRQTQRKRGDSTRPHTHDSPDTLHSDVYTLHCLKYTLTPAGAHDSTRHAHTSTQANYNTQARTQAKKREGSYLQNEHPLLGAGRGCARQVLGSSVARSTSRGGHATATPQPSHRTRQTRRAATAAAAAAAAAASEGECKAPRATSQPTRSTEEVPPARPPPALCASLPARIGYAATHRQAGPQAHACRARPCLPCRPQEVRAGPWSTSAS